MIQLSLNKLYAFWVSIMVLIPLTSFNNTGQKVKLQSEISKHIAIEKMKIDVALKQATYSNGLSNTY